MMDDTRASVQEGMSRAMSGLGAGLAAAMLTIGTASAQVPAPATKGSAAATATTKVNLDVLEGAWVRPDGGYLILIKKVGANGQLEASYFNPKPLPFAKAQATRDGATVRLAFELQAGGYSGSTYDLVYDATKDQLKGIYYQAVMKQKFEVFFTRK